MVGLEVTPYTEPARIRASSSPDWINPSLMVSSQTLWPSSWRSVMGVWSMGLGFASALALALWRRQHHAPAVRVGRADGAMAPRLVRRRPLEHHAARREIGVGLVHVFHHEVERRLLGRRGRHALHRRHESEARGAPGLDHQVLEAGIVVVLREPEELGVEALHT